MRHLRTLSGTIFLAAILSCARVSIAQATQADQSWSSTNQQGSAGGAINPTRTQQSHSEVNGRVVDKTSIERLGPDGRYVPFSDTEKESVRVNSTTLRTTERTYGRDADGHRTLIQETQQESRSLASGEQTVTRTMSSPDADGAMHVTRRESEHTREARPGVQVTNTTVLTPDGNGGMAPSLKTEQRQEHSNDGTVQSKKSTLLPDGNGGWQLSEERDTTTKPDGAGTSTKEERVLRPDSDGKLAVVERTVNRESQSSSGEKSETTDTYSTNVPGVAGDSSLQLVKRETTVHRNTGGGAKTTTRKIEQPPPGSPNGELHVTEEAIDIVRPGVNGTATETHTTLTSDADGHLGQVSVDMGKTNNPSAVQVDIAPKK
ncbi:MAG TPA: hypothetical protein VKV39_19385 [Candidatus Sulfotelmatobacter sp.]|nr:hypothetical protein [Candidatus Sulfotelmatobacter sp.]